MDPVIIPSDETIAKQVVISNLATHNVHFCNHDMICSLAINKEWNAFLIKTAPIRRDLLLKEITSSRGHLIKDGVLIWHKYGTACGKKSIYPSSDVEDKYDCQLRSIYWDFQKIEYCISKLWPCTKLMLKDYIEPRFNEDGFFCCYSPSKDKDFMLWDKREHIIEYCLPREKSRTFTCDPLEMNRCGFNIGEDVFSNYALSYFQQFEGVVKAFLNSKVVAGAGTSGTSKSYSLKYAILPDNYQDCDVSIDPRFRDKTFNDLPKKFKEAIIKHYEAQKARKIQ